MSSSPPWSTSIGSTTAACTASSTWSPQQSSRPPTSLPWSQQSWRFPNNRSLYQTRGGSTLFDQENRVRVVVALDDDGNPSIRLLDPNCNVIWQAPERPQT